MVVMRSQPEHGEDGDGRASLGDGQVKEMATATVSSIPSPTEATSGTGTQQISLPPLFKGTRSSSEDKLSDSSLLHSPILPSKPPSHIIDAQHPVLEAVVWDWQAPSQSTHPHPQTSDSNLAGLYEPQGELLLHERTGLASVRANEFSIPGPVPVNPPSASHIRLPTNPLEAALASHAVPGEAGVHTGAKRRSAPDLFQTAAKRPSLDKREFDQSGDYANAQIDSTTFDQDRRTLPATHPFTSAPVMVLPARKVFPIQIGDKLFRLSGASISSDAPSYFSQFFEEQLRQSSSSSSNASSDASSVRTLYIDRDPSTFCDISLHLQGYHIEPRDGAHFVRLFADAQFFSLPRLTSQLFASPIYTTVGSVPFQIPRDLFSSSPGNEPNYFTLGFQIFFTTPSDVFPGLSQRNLLRPPSLLPPSVPNRDAEVFADLLRMLKGYDVEIKSDQHRQSLLRDARYFNFRGLEQRLIRHRISYNSRRELEEIEVRLEDIRQSGVSFVAGKDVDGRDAEEDVRGDVYYARPYVDDQPRALILELGDEDGPEVLLDTESRVGALGLVRKTAARTRKLAGIVNEKVGLPAPFARNDKVIETEKRETFGLRCVFGRDADIVIDGKTWNAAHEGVDGPMDVDERNREIDLLVKESQWRVKIGPLDTTKISLEAVKIEAYSCAGAVTESRGFL